MQPIIFIAAVEGDFDSIYAFEREEDRDEFAALFTDVVVATGTLPVMAPDAAFQLIRAERSVQLAKLREDTRGAFDRGPFEGGTWLAHILRSC